MTQEVFGAPSGEGRATAAEPVVSALRDGILSAALMRLKREIAHHLAHKLELFSNNSRSYPPSKTDGFAAAKVADWQLRQWLSLIDAAQGIEAEEADETGTGSVHESAVPQAFGEPSTSRIS